ncbi:MAG: hypothetical protein K8I82_22715 [Anaerolineae bacterium]|nr:hypothetical protein [Anaerolineae bacterium]
MTMWYVGTFTLIGITVGMLIGFVLEQPPMGAVVGLGVGAALDSWLRQRSESE